ncbi:hypothetical protein N7492_001063 [Penicillium capsulatum]|uniref:Ankyrin repeat protein n=1 Tax=Penicillium capsulatum TaxID=69766 RepID=A0A9W9IT41_9EURO|nr:hypothetical protein N7492_001063 [Penicillium capsulatum]
MSDVDAVSLPAALDVGSNTLPVKADAPGPVSPGKVVPPRRRSNGSISMDSDGEGPPSPKADSEAETIIQSGRESLSPEKKRKHIKHDPLRQGVDGVDGVQRKRPRIDGHRRPPGSRSPSPSERPGSPPSVVKIEKSDEPQAVTRGVLEDDSANEADRPQVYRKRSFSDSLDGKGERRHVAHSSDGTLGDLKRLNTHLSRPSADTRSLSPSRTSHQRSVSGSHLHSRKKAPTPLTGFQRQGSEDRQSTSSSASGSPLPSAHLRRLGSGVGASASPAKQMGPKKLRDKSGRTPLARACADRKYDQVMLRHGERPEDLNVPDNAGNTPLQIASLNGEAPIVKFLLDAGCEINTKNIDKDTPLIDAVENGNVKVVKLLLEAGANPRTVNASGDEPYELVPQDLKEDEYDDIRKALADAKASARPGRRSEEQGDIERKPSTSRRDRRKTGRSEVTRNDLLWTQATSENLRDFAAKGDEVGVVSILNILQKADNASLIAAAKGGHHDVLSLMYAMGDADADPKPLRDHKPGYNTPMLAAIGRGRPDVIQLILNQPQFNPTRRLFDNYTYYELARARQGESWEEEYDILKLAYEKHSGSDKGRKNLSSPRRARGKERDEKRPARRESSSPVARPKKLKESPDVNRHRLPKDLDALKEKRREKEKQALKKAVPRDSGENGLTGPDHDTARPESTKSKPALSARRGSESSGVARTDEVRKRRLIAGRRPQEQDRRPSLFSSDSGREEAPIPRTQNAPDAIPSLKRIRTETSPERSRSRGSESDRLSPEARKKKRRVFSDEKPSSGPNGATRTVVDEVDGDKAQSRRVQGDPTRTSDSLLRKPAEPAKATASSQQLPDAEPAKKIGEVKTESSESNRAAIANPSSDETRAEIEAEKQRQAEAKKAEEERAAEARRAFAEAERARLAKEEAERAERAAQASREKAEEDERKRKEAEQRRAKQAEDERQKRLEQERARMLKIRRDQEAQEHRRRDALPGRLRASARFIGSNDPRARNHAWLKNFMPLVTVVTEQLEPHCARDVADEKWIPNYLAAPLLATNDLQLSQCKCFLAFRSWEMQ